MLRPALRVHYLLPLLLLAAGLGGCSLFGTSKTERIARFEADLNGNRHYLYENFLPAETDDYALIRDSDLVYTWDKWFPLPYPEGGSYSITIEDSSGDPITATVEGPEIFDGPRSAAFYFVRSGLYWYLNRLDLGGGAIVD
jgi:hypothetical protein